MYVQCVAYAEVSECTAQSAVQCSADTRDKFGIVYGPVTGGK